MTYTVQDTQYVLYREGELCPNCGGALKYYDQDQMLKEGLIIEEILTCKTCEEKVVNIFKYVKSEWRTNNDIP